MHSKCLATLNLASVLLLLFSCIQDSVNEHIIVTDWRFAIGDDPTYKSLSYNDNNWKNINIDRYWEKQGYEGYDGYAWYRAKIFIPSSLRRKAALKDSLKLFLGKIDDYDQVYLNGRLLGENNITILPGAQIQDKSFVQEPTKYNIERKYVIPWDDERILWDRDNLIAVRVFDEKENGGFSSDIQSYLAVVGLEDYISFNKVSFYEVDQYGNVNTSLEIKNSSSLNLKGTIIILGENIEKKQLVYNVTFPVELRSGQMEEIIVDLPVCTDSLRVSFNYKDIHYKAIVYDEKVIPYALAVPQS